MLKKVLKYDLRYIYKELVIFYALAIVFSLIGRGLGIIENSVIFGILSQFSLGLAVGMMLGSLINCMLKLWERFVKNFYKDEAYLTHTLPVEKKTLYLSKVLSSVITIFTTTIVIILCLFISYYSEANMENIKQMLEIAASTYNLTVVSLLLLVCAVLFFQMLFISITGYVGIIIGHRSTKSRMVKSLITGFVLYMLAQVISIVFVFVFGVFNADVMNLINTTETINIDIIKYLMYGAIGLYFAYILVYYLLGKKQFEKGVNVD